MGFRVSLIEKILVLVEVHDQLYSNKENYLRSPQTNWIFLDPNPNEIYDKTINILQLN